MSASAAGNPIRVTVFTGFLGAGKTTIILKAIQEFQSRYPAALATATATAPSAAQAPPYTLALLKNEFGDVEIDSQLAKESSISVAEMLNGCLCCVLVGQMQNALLEMKQSFRPDRILIETSGSAFPAPIVWQLKELEKDGFLLDAIVTVIDAVNFKGYADTSYTAKLQAKYTDLIVINKAELVSERQLDLVIDKICDLNADTPRVTAARGFVSLDLIFGLDPKLALLRTAPSRLAPDGSAAQDSRERTHHANEVDVVSIQREGLASPFSSFEAIAEKLAQLPKDDVYRLKGMVLLTPPAGEPSAPGFYLVNYAFRRFELVPLRQYTSPCSARLTVMGVGLRQHLPQLVTLLGLQGGEYTLHEREEH